ncbi:hypothetical protein FrEUN1fDRAFT_4887 [Parafrankia sp. EUN1f]|nr:hypothetical protein FrEUN1fDRAFT_4887 [Parafrankia sp. EUN1f]
MVHRATARPSPNGWFAPLDSSDVIDPTVPLRGKYVP